MTPTLHASKENGTKQDICSHQDPDESPDVQTQQHQHTTAESIPEKEGFHFILDNGYIVK
jgi:hypothetical protein